MVERWTLRMKMKVNNIIVTIQTNGGGKGKKKSNTPKTTSFWEFFLLFICVTMPFRQKHIISFKLLSQLSI
jgi:hypothetical protein